MKKTAIKKDIELSKFKFIEDAELGYYKIRYKDFIIGTFNFASFVDKEIVRENGIENSLTVILRNLYEDKIEIKVSVSEIKSKKKMKTTGKAVKTK